LLGSLLTPETLQQATILHDYHLLREVIRPSIISISQSAVRVVTGKSQWAASDNTAGSVASPVPGIEAANRCSSE
jgi:hypothetical protein